MTIYIEYFLLQNIIINFCLLRLTYLTTKCQTNTFRLILSSLLGSVFSVVAVQFLNKITLMNIIKLLCSYIMLRTAFKQTKKHLIFNYILLFLYTYALGGLITSISSTTYYTSFGIVTSSSINLWAVCSLIIAFTYIFELVVKHIKFKVKTNNLIYKLTLEKDNQKLTINAYLDTGNLLNHEGKPVIIVDLNSYLKLTNTNLAHFLTNKTDEIKTHTVTGCNNLKLFTVDRLTITKDNSKIELKNQYIAVSLTSNFKTTNYQALLTPLIL